MSLDDMAEAQARRESLLREHVRALADKIHGVMTVACYECAPNERELLELMKVVNSPLTVGMVAWMRAQDVYREVRDRMRRHKNNLARNEQSGRRLFELSGYERPEVESRLDQWRALLRLGA